MSITVHDLGPVETPQALALSPHLLIPANTRIKFTLNFKKLAFKVVNIGIHELESTAKSVDAPPSPKNPDGSPKCTVPFIHDSKARKDVSNPFRIAEYLDEAYPDTPKIVPARTRALHYVFVEKVSDQFNTPLSRLYMPLHVEFTPEVVQVFIERFGNIPLSPTDEQRAEAWKKAQAGLYVNELVPVYGTGDGLFLTGEKPFFADLALATMLATVKIAYGADSEEWKNVKRWIGGGARELVEKVIKYERVSA